MSELASTAPISARPEADPGASADLRRRLAGGFAWSLASNGAIQLSRVLVALVLARLLTPSDYGLAGMALVFSSLVLTFSDLSLGAALVQREEITEEDRSTVFWTTVAIGVVLMLAGIGLSGPLADLYHRPAVKPLFEVVSIGFLLLALQVTQASILQREMRFRVTNLRLAAAGVVGGVVGIAAALAGAGAWALIAQQLTATAVSTAALWLYSSWRPHLIYSVASLRKLGGFGFNLLGAGVLNFLNRNTDNIVVGRFLGSAALGTYSLAYNLMMLPLERLIAPIQDTLYPAYSRWQGDIEKLRTVWLRVFRIVAAVVFPAMLGLAVVAHDLVGVVLGSRWLPAVPVLQVLCLVAIVQSLAALGNKLLAAVDRTQALLRLSLISTVLTITAFVVGLRWGILGVAVCYAIVTLPIQSLYLRSTCRALKMRMRDPLATMIGPAVAGVAMAAVCVVVQQALTHAGVHAGIRLLVVSLAGAVTFLGALRVVAPDIVQELERLVRAGARSRTSTG